MTSTQNMSCDLLICGLWFDAWRLLTVYNLRNKDCKMPTPYSNKPTVENDISSASFDDHAVHHVWNIIDRIYNSGIFVFFLYTHAYQRRLDSCHVIFLTNEITSF